MLRRRAVVRRGPGLLGMAARTAVVAGTATAVSGRVARHQQEKYAGPEAGQQPPPRPEPDQAQQPERAGQAAPTAGPGGGDLMTSLKQLADLHDAGALTDEEFAAAKAKLLG